LNELPTPSQVIETLIKAGCSPQIVEHSKVVSQLAVRLAKLAKDRGINVDIDLVRIGGLLHDIGRSRTHGVEHGYVGSTLAESYGLPPDVVRIIERHVGSGIPAEEAVGLGLPKRDLVPETLEEKIVSYADKLIQGKRRVSIDQALDKFAKDLGANHPALDRLRQLHEELVRIFGEPQ